MTDKYDQFSDIVQSQAGIFGRDAAAMENGLHAHDSVQTSVMQDGVHVSMSCRKCGNPRDVTIEWPELIAIKYQISPHEAYRGAQVNFHVVPWQYSPRQDGWYPLLQCQGCGEYTSPIVTPHEAEAHLQTARMRGWFRQQDELAYAKVAAQNAALQRQHR